VLRLYEILDKYDLTVSTPAILGTPNASLGLFGNEEGRLSEQDQIIQCRLSSGIEANLIPKQTLRFLQEVLILERLRVLI
jgi:hypothetical protein